MAIHYHGTPITPKNVIWSIKGHNFCVSFYRPEQISLCHQIGQSVMIDNGAFSYWKNGENKTDWSDYYSFLEPWLKYQTTWAIIPDVIDGGEKENNDLVSQWPYGIKGAPVWHLHESEHRLFRLCDDWPKVCLGSSGAYATIGTPRWHERMIEIMNRLCGDGPPPVWLHMLRGSGQVTNYPFASVDSTNVAQNHHFKKCINQWVDQLDGLQSPPVWRRIIPRQTYLAQR